MDEDLALQLAEMPEAERKQWLDAVELAALRERLLLTAPELQQEDGNALLAAIDKVRQARENARLEAKVAQALTKLETETSYNGPIFVIQYPDGRCWIDDHDPICKQMVEGGPIPATNRPIIHINPVKGGAPQLNGTTPATYHRRPANEIIQPRADALGTAPEVVGAARRPEPGSLIERLASASLGPRRPPVPKVQAHYANHDRMNRIIDLYVGCA